MMAKPNWKRTVGQNLRHLKLGEARKILAQITAEGPTIFHGDIKRLTGGFNSQSINFYVIRKLNEKAKKEDAE